MAGGLAPKMSIVTGHRREWTLHLSTSLQLPVWVLSQKESQPLCRGLGWDLTGGPLVGTLPGSEAVPSPPRTGRFGCSVSLLLSRAGRPRDPSLSDLHSDTESPNPVPSGPPVGCPRRTEEQMLRVPQLASHRPGFLSPLDQCPCSPSPRYGPSEPPTCLGRRRPGLTAARAPHNQHRPRGSLERRVGRAVMSRLASRLPSSAAQTSASSVPS